MKKTFLFSLALISGIAGFAQNPTTNQQQRRGTIIDPRKAGTAVLVFSERNSLRDYTQPVVLSTLPTGMPTNPAFILMRSGGISGINGTYTPDLSLNGLTNYTSNSISARGIGNLPGMLTSPGFTIGLPGVLPGILPSLPSIIPPFIPITNPIIPPIIPPKIPPIIPPIIPGGKPIIPGII
jgi:hypothetical protein